jgi:Flp pilus assembly protein TadD
VDRAGDAEAQTNLLLTQIRCRDLDVSTASPTHKTISDLLGSHPDSQEGLLLQATLAIAENDWRTATPLEAKLNQMGENTGILAYNIGVLQQKENLLAEAIDSYDRACGQRPCFAEAHLNRGHALMQIGETERARADWVDALEAKPELANSYFKDVAISELPTGVA